MDWLIPMSERVPVDETLQALEYIRHERDKDSVRQYFEDVMPFNGSTAVKYRRRLFERYLTIDGDEVAYTPFLQMLSETNSHQTKKEILFYMTVAQTGTLQSVLKDIHEKVLRSTFSRDELMNYLKKRMADHKQSTMNKTFSVVINILKDFNVIIEKKDSIKKEIRYTVNDRMRPTNETIAFCLYYEFFEIQDNRMPNAERLPNADTFKYLLVNRLLAERYIKWLVSNDFMELHKMGANEQYQFTCSSLHDFVEKVMANVKT